MFVATEAGELKMIFSKPEWFLCLKLNRPHKEIKIYGLYIAATIIFSARLHFPPESGKGSGHSNIGDSHTHTHTYLHDI